MRRLFAFLSALLFLGSLAGCNHTCGMCDCDSCSSGMGCCCTCAGMGYHSACGVTYVPPPPVPTAMPPMADEVIKKAPTPETKPDDKKPDEPKSDKKPEVKEETSSDLKLPNP